MCIPRPCSTRSSTPPSTAAAAPPPTRLPPSRLPLLESYCPYLSPVAATARAPLPPPAPAPSRAATAPPPPPPLLVARASRCRCGDVRRAGAGAESGRRVATSGARQRKPGFRLSCPASDASGIVAGAARRGRVSPPSKLEPNNDRDQPFFQTGTISRGLARVPFRVCMTCEA